MLKRAAIVQVPLDEEGRLDLNLPPDSVRKEIGTPFIHLHWKEEDGDVHTAVCQNLGSLGSDRVYLVIGTPKILKGLFHLGTKVTLLRLAWENEAKREWLMDHGVPEVDGMPVPTHAFAGDNRAAIGRDHAEVEE